MNREPAPRQLPLDLRPAPGHSLDDMVVTPANAEAVDMVRRWPDWPTPVVVLAGPPGSGKSHLGAIWRARADAVEGLTGGLPAFIDNADEGALDETGLFHLVNAARQAGSSVLIAARRFPAAWGLTLPDLSSRLKAATTVEIHEPDDALLAGVITKLFADRQIEVEPHVVSYLVRRIERSLATAIDVVERLDAAALDRQTRITRALAAEVVSAMDEGQQELPLEGRVED